MSAKERIVHFDLKGAPLKVSYIKKILPILKSLGATGILLEYEDTFPYTNNLKPIKAKNSYTKREIIQILQSAYSNNLNVIPLVQTFGHLEFSLKVKEFQHLREVKDSANSICPSLNSSKKFIEDLVTQVILLHTINQEQKKIPQLNQIHIGCDEVYQLGECNLCRNKLPNNIFLEHVYYVASFIKKKWPNLTVLIWDDQLRKIDKETLRHSGISEMVEIMIWGYTEDIYKFINSQTWENYSRVFKSCWVAGAFKGAFGETNQIVQGRRHLENAQRWLAIIQGEGSR